MRSILLADHVGIRRYREDDAPLLHEAAQTSTAEAYPWLPWCYAGYRLDEAETFARHQVAAWEAGKEFSFVVFDRESDRFVGGVGINYIHPVHRFANLGYWIRSDCTRRGFASAAARLAAAFALGDMGLRRVEIVAAVGNVASQRVAEKAGAHREGILRNRLYLHGEAVDAVMYSIV
ncbi:MAG TPA: GNAT family protein [Candidatus Xenobia bacterium]|jgi:RimJ/RimL family protein N-acetyltransferase